MLLYFCRAERHHPVRLCFMVSLKHRALSLVFSFAVTTFVFSCQTNPYHDGEALYKTQCANCHMDSGEGLSALIPTLAKADYLMKHRDQLPCILWHGLSDTIAVNGKIYAEQMPANPALTEVDIANILNYVNTAWGNNNPLYSLEEVKRMLERCPK